MQIVTELHDLEPAKTVADCFKFRNKVGLDVAVEALRECLSDRRATPDEILEYARVCRVEGVVRPYLEALASTYTPSHWHNRPLHGILHN